jgi:acetyl-CoA C-acetyltransferase
MLATAELVARELGATRAQADAVTVLRSEQYARARAADVHRRYLVPVLVAGRAGTTLTVDWDEGVRAVTAESAASLPTVDPEGIHTYASQTHPADGTAGCIVTSRQRAAELANGAGVADVMASGFARAGRSRMPEAPVPAAYRALDAAGLTFDDIHAVTTHNPFAVNDLWFSTQTGFPLERMNAYGCSLVFGHPQAPTGMRSIAELIVELVERGGGIGLFSGCAAGDTAAALVLRVDDAAAPSR